MPLIITDTIKAFDTVGVVCCSGVLKDFDGLLVPEFFTLTSSDYLNHQSTAVSGDHKITLTFDEALASATEASLIYVFGYRIDGGD